MGPIWDFLVSVGPNLGSIFPFLGFLCDLGSKFGVNLSLFGVSVKSAPFGAPNWGSNGAFGAGGAQIWGRFWPFWGLRGVAGFWGRDLGSKFGPFGVFVGFVVQIWVNFGLFGSLWVQIWGQFGPFWGLCGIWGPNLGSFWAFWGLCAIQSPNLGSFCPFLGLCGTKFGFIFGFLGVFVGFGGKSPLFGVSVTFGVQI